MKRTIVHIDEDKCNGCGQCVTACAEGALAIVDGKAKLVGEVLCDGLGACIGTCPQDALHIETREADSFDEAAVERHLEAQKRNGPSPGRPETASSTPKACPGTLARMFDTPGDDERDTTSPSVSHLASWPVQLMLVPPQAPFLRNADLLFCADCVPFAVPGFHSEFLKGHVPVVGCPKLDDLSHYREKIRDILAGSQPESVSVARMEVPCCGGLAQAIIDAHTDICPHVPLHVHTVGIGGDIETNTKRPAPAATVGNPGRRPV